MSDFEVKSLCEVAHCRMGETILSTELDRSGYPVYSADSSSGPWGYKQKIGKILKKGCLVVGARGTIGNPRLPDDEKFGCTQTTIAIIPKQEIYPYYLKLALEKSDIRSIAAQQAVPMLTVSNINQLPIPIPPLPEQKKIAEILSGIDRILYLYKSKRDIVLRQIKGVTNNFFTEIVGKVPFVDISSFGSIVTGSTPSTSDIRNYGGAIPFISPGDINSQIFVRKTKTTLSDQGAQNARIVPPNSVSVVCIGSTIGKVAITSHESVTNQQINSILPDKYDEFYLLAAINFYCEDIRKAASTHAVPIINKSKFSEIKLPRPPLQQQQLLGRFIASSYAVVELLDAHIQKTSMLRQAIASDLLSGHKRVTI